MIGRKSQGMPCIWILDMFPPSSETTIVIPYKKNIQIRKSDNHKLLWRNTQQQNKNGRWNTIL